ncbi:transglutaminase domain-containing protein [Gilvimarinus xylanilyticus]|uniref:Transglutaminase-like domain-containing protein n=1 Tax=Gilvimarinus xylanilyticus TaxID=2944139 RepID=A0A9X2KTE0_9GAMM|nr:transglutaminase domain-containing protein [Gilvimarinus xylanilyticus]MCP8899816.1 hypothetical protein [Gilvimarinus xylanilyticus]
MPLMVLALFGCASNRLLTLIDEPAPDLIARALTQAAPAQPNKASTVADQKPLPKIVSVASIMTLTPAMASFAEQAVAGAHGDAMRVRALHQALILPASAGGLGIGYQPLATLTPAQVFRTREANCLSFSLLFVAMARHLGLDASLNDVAVPPSWTMNNDRVQFMRHVNAKVDLRFSSDDMVIDLDMSNYRPYYQQQLIDDKTAIAQYYNNLAMSLDNSASNGDIKLAYMRAALGLDSAQSYLWNNLAAIYMGWDQSAVAEALYLKAVQVNPDDVTAIWNLSEFYRLRGNTELANALQQRVTEYRDSNPYYQYRLASVYFADDQYELAAQRIQSAIAKQPEEERFYRLAEDIYQSMEHQGKGL